MSLDGRPRSPSWADGGAFRLVEALRVTPGLSVSEATIRPPCSDADIEEVEKAIGYVLSDSFKAYYRAADGAKVVWAGPNGCGGFDLLPLREVFLDRIGYIFGFDNVERGENTEPVFGGVDEHTLRRMLRRFDAARVDGNSYPTVALVGSSSFPDPAQPRAGGLPGEAARGAAGEPDATAAAGRVVAIPGSQAPSRRDPPKPTRTRGPPPLCCALHQGPSACAGGFLSRRRTTETFPDTVGQGVRPPAPCGELSQSRAPQQASVAR